MKRTSQATPLMTLDVLNCHSYPQIINDLKIPYIYIVSSSWSVQNILQVHIKLGWLEELCNQAPLEPSAASLSFISKAVVTTEVSELKLWGANARAKEVKRKDERQSGDRWASRKSQQITEVTAFLQEPEADEPKARVKLILLSSIYCSGSFQRKMIT